MPNDLFSGLRDGSIDSSLLLPYLQPQYEKWSSFQDLIDLVKAGTLNPNEVYAWVSQHGYDLSAEDEKFLDNAIASWNTEQSQQWQTDMRDSSISSTAEQYEALGLSGSNVLQGQIASTPNTGIADNSKGNLSEQKAQRKLAMTQTIVNLIRGLASAGIGGGALMAAKKLGAKSGLQTVSALGSTSQSYEAPNDEPLSREFYHWLHNY